MLCCVCQDLIRANASSLAPLFDKGAHVYICGDAKVTKLHASKYTTPTQPSTDPCTASAFSVSLTAAWPSVSVSVSMQHMAPDVREAFAWVLSESKGLGIEQGRAVLDALVADNRYHEDVWAS